MPHRLTLQTLIDRLSRGEVTSREATQACLDRIHQVDPSLHAFLHIDTEGALRAADAADAALAAGARVTGVIPEVLQIRELAHRGLSDLRVVRSMHERKALMAELSDGFVALPGGMGTLEELAEVLTWAQLGLHARPVGLLDVGGYYRPLVAFFDQAVAAGFLRPHHRAILHEDEAPEPLLDRLAAWRPSGPVEQVIGRAQS